MTTIKITAVAVLAFGAGLLVRGPAGSPVTGIYRIGKTVGRLQGGR